MRSGPVDHKSDVGVRVQHIGLVLVPEFPVYALTLAMEALRVANQNAGKRFFAAQLISVDGAPVVAGNGALTEVGCAISDAPFTPIAIVFACNHPEQHNDARLLAWLRRLDRHGALIGAVDTGQFLLAEAGLLDGYRVSLHWEAMPLFCEKYPFINVRQTLFTIDRNRITCAGGVATLDMFLNLISITQGHRLAEVVANGMVYGRIRQEDEDQLQSVGDTLGHSSQRLAKIIELMECHLEKPMSIGKLAEKAGISLRQVERLMRDSFNETPSSYYRKVRLQAARNMLFYSDLPVQEIAQICGFSSPSVFSRAFGGHFKVSPSEFRRQYQADRLKRFRPEIRQQSTEASIEI